MSKLGQRLIESANQAVAIAEGRMQPARAFAPVDVAAIRKKLGLSQAQFAERYQLSAATVRDWEQKRRVPDRPAANFLTMIDRAPDVVEKVMAGKVGGAASGPGRAAAAKRHRA
jgi:putative transcriptional regulator